LKRLLFVCMGNICRSPLAEGIARRRALDAQLDLVFDSAGTEAYHVGQAPDPRARAVARARGASIDDLRARQVDAGDFRRFDLILAADRGNLRRLEALRPSDARAEQALLLPWAGAPAGTEVPDPYYGDAADFSQVFDLLDGCMAALLARASTA
jgi:protein-tyrosine phosphatase